MRNVSFTLLALAAFSASALGEDPAPPIVPAVDPGPIVPVGPTPSVPPPRPDATLPLVGDQLYVVQWKKEFVVRSFPEGLIKVSYKKGPRDFTAKFWDGTGKIEDRSYDGPFIAVVQASGKGAVALDIVPVQFTKESEFKRINLLVNDGTAPQPPPVPDIVPVPPTPVPPKPIALGKLNIVVLQDRTNADPAQTAALSSLSFRSHLTEIGASFEIVDVSSPAAKARATAFQPFLDKWKVTGNAIIVMDTGSAPPNMVMDVKPLPSSDKELNTILSTLTGK